MAIFGRNALRRESTINRDRLVRGYVMLSVVSAVLACRGSMEPPHARSIAISGGNNQTATAGSALSVAPSVEVLDGNGIGFSGVVVTFAVASGGGSVTGVTATTGSTGTAAVGSWTLGPTAGTNA